jgi:glutamate racemase
MPDSSQPIGVFDSGLGGLTVAKELFAQLPAEDVIYFGDVGRYPYGPRSKEIITQFTRQDVNTLVHRLRKSLGEYGQYIENIPSFGYRLI